MSDKDDGVYTSAPAASVGSLLTDLLSEAKKDVAAQRQELNQKIQSREDVRKEEQRRAEARRREEMQRELIEETRRRNEAIARNDVANRSPEAATLLEEVKAEPEPVIEKVVEAAPAEPTRAGGVGWPLVAAIVLGCLALGVGGALALAPKQKLVLPDVEVAAKTTVQQTVRAASSEARLTGALAKTSAELKTLSTQVAALKTAQANLKGQLKATSAQIKGSTF